MEWSTVFDEGYPNPGATVTEIESFVSTVGQPITLTEIEEIKREPALQPYSRVEPSKWVIPDKRPPASYLDFLLWSNGGEFRKGERWFQFFPALDPMHGVRAMLLAYHLPFYMPDALPFAFNGSGTFYLFDERKLSIAGEHPVICAEAGNLGWEPDQVTKVANSFLAACQGMIDVDDLWWH